MAHGIEEARDPLFIKASGKGTLAGGSRHGQPRRDREAGGRQESVEASTPWGRPKLSTFENSKNLGSSPRAARPECCRRVRPPTEEAPRGGRKAVEERSTLLKPNILVPDLCKQIPNLCKQKEQEKPFPTKGHYFAAGLSTIVSAEYGQKTTRARLSRILGGSRGPVDPAPKDPNRPFRHPAEKRSAPYRAELLAAQACKCLTLPLTPDNNLGEL